ncbi:MAG TPA: sigma-70 family RNA polymerase sigma factor [Pyrinomonadaceae bacterium]|jgi:RNA polymerase sigma-70 factor (ECF subfamily)
MQNDAVPLVLSEKGMDTDNTIAATSVNWNIDPTVWVDEHGDYLFRYALMRLRNETLAEDMVQETLLAAIQSLAAYSGKSSERTWLTGILKHKIVDYYRKSSRETPLDESELDLSGFDKFFERDDEWKNHWNPQLAPRGWTNSPEAVFEQNEFFDVFQTCMSKLPERVAHVFALREMDGFDACEICEILNLSTSNFWVMMHRARMSLRRCIEIKWFRSAH